MRRIACAALFLALSGIVSAQDSTTPPFMVLDAGGHTARVNRVLFTPDGKQLVSISNDKTIRVWDLNSGTVRVLRPPIGKGNEGALYAASLSPDGKMLAVGGYPPGGSRDGTPIYLITLATGKIHGLLYGHKNTITDLAFSPDGKRLASASMDKTTRIWDPVAGSTEKVLEGHSAMVRAVAWSPDGDRLVTGSTDKTARIWSAEGGAPAAVLKGHEGDVSCVAWSRDGKAIATGGTDQTVRIWEPDGKFRKQYDKLGNHITSVTFTNKCRGILFTRGSAEFTDKTCTLRNIFSDEDVVNFTKHSNTVMSGRISPDGKLAATCGGLSHEIYVWNLADGAVQQRLAGRAHAALSAAWDPAGGAIAWGRTNKGSTLRADLPLERSFRLAELAMYSVANAAFSRTEMTRDWLTLEVPNHTSVAIKASGDARASPLKTLGLASAQDRVRCFSFLTADRVVVGSSQKLDVYDTTTGRRIRTLEGHTDEVWAVAPAPNHRWLLSASLDQTVRIWDAEALLRSEPLGIGVIFQMQDGYPVVTGLIPGSTGAKDGRLKVKDRIVAIASRGSAFTDVKEKAATDVVELLTGPDGSLVRLKVTRDGQDEPVEYELQRQPINGWVPRSEPLLSLFAADNDEWVAWTPDGYFAASPGGDKLIGLHINNGPNRMATFHPMERFARSLYRPDIIARIVETGSVERAIALADLVGGKKTVRTEMARVLPPKVQITSPAQAAVDVNDDEIEVTATAQQSGSNPIRALRLLLNGRPYGGSKGIKRFPAPGLPEATASWKVFLPSGRNRLVVKADSDVSQGDSEAVEVVYAVGTPPRGKLWVLAIGIATYPDDNLKLYYAAKDARDVAQRLRDKGVPKPFERVEYRLLTNKDATRAAILKALKDLKESMKPEDNAWVFFSGHGERDSTGMFYLLPVDVDLKRLADTAVSSDDLKTTLVDTPGQVMLVLDACHSGAVDLRAPSPGVSDELARDLGRDENGVIVMCSSMARQKSLEDNDNQHSSFSQAVLEGLLGKGGKGQDGVVYQHHLDSYVTERVKGLTKGQQTPTTTKPGNLPPFPLTKP